MKRITSDDLNSWAGKIEARGDFPALIKKLILSTLARNVDNLQAFDFPESGSINRKEDVDGKLHVVKGNVWVPDGKTVWELSCAQDVNKKANSDYNKRDSIEHTGYVFATPRQWAGKADWVEAKNKEGKWKEVRALDADDFAAWLDVSVSARVWMENELWGRDATDYLSASQAWEQWAGVTEPSLSHHLILAEREYSIEAMKKWIQQEHPEDFFRVYADSCDEAVAFVCAAMKKRFPEQGDKIIVVRSDKISIEQFIQDGKPPPIFLLASEKFAHNIGDLQKRAPVIIAQAREGVRAQNIIERQRAIRSSDFTLLNRISSHGIAQALEAEDMNIPEKTARQLVRESGRSVTVLRRRMTSNPAITSPPWINPPWTKNTDAMVVAALVGTWDSAEKYDRNFLAEIAGMDYIKFEEKINEFRHIDDAPVEKIGSIWGVKSHIDALLGIANYITPAKMEPFWRNIGNIFHIQNSAGHLSEMQQFASPTNKHTILYYSNALFSSIADTLVLLALHHKQITACDDIKAKVDSVVRETLKNAGSDGWNFLHALLPQLAEASPDIFLSALERDLQKEIPDTSTMFSNTNHTGVLWALETLAWDKHFLPRVIQVLAKMTEKNFPPPVNYANTPINTLLSFFRAWYPQCGADIDERIKLFERLRWDYPKTAWNLSLQVLRGQDAAFPIALPQWSGIPEFANRKVTYEEIVKMRNTAFKVMVDLIDGNQGKIAIILEMFEVFDEEQMQKIIQIIETWQKNAKEADWADMDEKIIKNIYLCNLRSKDKNDIRYAALIKMFQVLREKKIPQDPVLQYKWLFSKEWVGLPDYPQREKTEEERDHRRMNAIREIYKAQESAGIFQMAADCGVPGLVGVAVADALVKNDNDRMQWASDTIKSSMETQRKRGFMAGVFSKVTQWGDFASFGLTQAKKEKWEECNILAFTHALCPCVDVWDVIEATCPEHIRLKYWKGDVRPSDKKDLPRFVSEMIKADKTDIAFDWAAAYNFHDVKADIVMQMLFQLLPEPEAQFSSNSIISPYEIGKGMSYITCADIVSEDKKIRLEIAYFETLRYSEYQPTAIFKRLATDPSFFIDAVCKIYGKEGESEIANKYWRILHDWNIPPGCVGPGDFNHVQFSDWMKKTRELADKAGYLKQIDMQIGQILRHLPKGDGKLIFPENVLQWLEKHGTEEMFRALSTSYFDSRGIYSKSFDDGGGQERKIADKYRNIGESLPSDYPRLAKIFTDLASSYEEMAKYQDTDAELRDRRWN